MKDFARLKALLMTLPPDLKKVEAELQTHAYTAEEVTELACDFAEAAFCDYAEVAYAPEPRPSDEKLYSTYVYAVCELFLRYGLDPNMILGEEFDEKSIMNEVYWIDRPYVAADTLRLLLEHGGDPELKIEQKSLFGLIEDGVYFDLYERYAGQDWYRIRFDCRLHNYFVMLAAVDEECSFLWEHEKYTAECIRTDRRWDIRFIPRTQSDTFVLQEHPDKSEI